MYMDLLWCKLVDRMDHVRGRSIFICRRNALCRCCLWGGTMDCMRVWFYVATVIWPYVKLLWPLVQFIIKFLILKGNSALKNISPKINIYDKWIYVSVIKLMMQIRYRRILMIKLPISLDVFLHGGGSSKPSSLFLYLCLFVAVDMVTRNGCAYVLSCIKNVLCFHCLAGNSAIIRSISPTLFYM